MICSFLFITQMLSFGYFAWTGLWSGDWPTAALPHFRRPNSLRRRRPGGIVFVRRWPGRFHFRRQPQISCEKVFPIFSEGEWISYSQLHFTDSFVLYVWQPRTLEHHVTEEEKKSCCMVGHTRQVTCLSVSLDGTTVASGSDDTTVRIWSSSSRQCLRTLPHKGPVTNVVIAIPPPGTSNKLPTFLVFLQINVIVSFFHISLLLLVCFFQKTFPPFLSSFIG